MPKGYRTVENQQVVGKNLLTNSGLFEAIIPQRLAFPHSC